MVLKHPLCTSDCIRSVPEEKDPAQAEHSGLREVLACLPVSKLIN